MYGYKMLHDKCPNRRKSKPLAKGCFSCSLVHCGLLYLGSSYTAVHNFSAAIFSQESILPPVLVEVIDSPVLTTSHLA